MARVLVIDSTEWVLGLLAESLRRAGHEVTACSNAREGLEAACREGPACIVCAVDLPDEDGYWVAQQVRAQTSPVAVAPFLFMTAADDPESRVEGLKVGGDAHVSKPFRVEEVVAQVDALVRMFSRLREGQELLSSRPPSPTAAIEGELTEVSIGTMLSVLEIERRTGVFDVVAAGRPAVRLVLVGGFVIGATVAGMLAQPLDAMRSLLAGKKGRFTFTPTPARPVPERKHSISRLLAACDLDKSREPPVSEAPDSIPIDVDLEGVVEPDAGLIDVEADLDSYRPPPS